MSKIISFLNLFLVYQIFKNILPWFHPASYIQIEDWWQNLDKICPICKMGKDQFSQTLLDIKNVHQPPIVGIQI
jgi:hypothetical protein